MKFDIVLAGVGGQGVLSVAGAIAAAALDAGYEVQQSEVHGMSQRGGAVSATLRIADQPIAGPLVSQGSASLLLSMEPLETLRYLEYLGPRGLVISATAPVQNISAYPELSSVLDRIRALPHSQLVDADKLARDAGSARASNIVLVGAASRALPIKAEAIEGAIGKMFARKGAKVVEINLAAFRAGRDAAHDDV